MFYGKLCKEVRLIKFCDLIGYLSGQDVFHCVPASKWLDGGLVSFFAYPVILTQQAWSIVRI